MVYIETFILIAVLSFVIYKWSQSKFGELKKRGIPHDEPSPIVGNNSLKVLFGRQSFLETTLQQYSRFKDSKVYGIYNFQQPTIIIRDLESIKKIGIKDFDSFPNHQAVSADLPESTFTKSLIALRDRKWRAMRNTLTPSFTGSKMRLMHEMINECSMEAVKYIEDEIKTSGKNELDVAMKDFFTRFTNDVIATSAFGIKVNSFKDKDNEFFVVGSSLTSFKPWNLIKFFLFILMPKVMKFLGADFIDTKKMNYFQNLVVDAIDQREAHNIFRPDMIQLLMEAKSKYENLDSAEKSEHPDFNDRQTLVAQCLIFFIAGFATVSSCLCFTVHELLQNQEVQERLYEEIKNTEKELDGQPIDYDKLVKMKYLDMVISESLRLWPPTTITDRMCGADYKLTDNEVNFVVEIKKDEIVQIPIIAIHRDSEYYKDADKFIPERFSENNRKEIPAMAYLPFGIGPRNCIGNRFALMETKSLLYHLILKFKVSPTEKTSNDLLRDIQSVNLEPKKGFWAKFIPREIS